jgi:3-hydroxymyristoyl/3-hydroxydecanoyl-(acyl carrier protein) dehydratase
MPVISELAVDADARSLSCLLLVPRDLPVFRGHFPGVPIVPGVMQVGWAVELARGNGLAQGPLVGIGIAKFRRILRPGMRLDARVGQGAMPGQLHFSYALDGTIVSSGRLQFGVGHD